MSIVSDKPESGVRIALERPREGGPPWTYTGAAELPDTRYPLVVVISAEGAVAVTLAEESAGDTLGAAAPATPYDLLERVRLLVRTAFRQAKADGEPPARRIVRWRPAGDSAT